MCTTLLPESITISFVFFTLRERLLAWHHYSGVVCKLVNWVGFLFGCIVVDEWGVMKGAKNTSLWGTSTEVYCLLQPFPNLSMAEIAVWLYFWRSFLTNLWTKFYSLPISFFLFSHDLSIKILPLPLSSISLSVGLTLVNYLCWYLFIIWAHQQHQRTEHKRPAMEKCLFIYVEQATVSNLVHVWMNYSFLILNCL